MLSLLTGNRSFRRLWLGETTSLLGDWLSYVAVALLAVERGEGPLALVVVLAAHVLPEALTAPFAGALVDRFDARRLLLGSALVQGLLTAGMVVAAAMPSLLALYLLLFARTAVGGALYPTKHAAIQRLLPKGDRVAANALDAGTWSVTFAVGTALGGLATQAGPVLALAADVLTFGVAAWLYRGLPAMPAGDLGTVARPTAARFGLIVAARLALRDRPLFLAVFGKTALAVGGGAMWIHLHTVAELSAETWLVATGVSIGVLHAIRGVGTGIAPLLAHRLHRAGLPASRLLGVSQSLGVVGMAGFVLAPTLITALLSALVWGIASGGSWVFSSQLLQTEAPADRIGKLAGLDQLAMKVAMTGSALLGASAQIAAGPSAAGWMGVSLAAVGTAVLLAGGRRTRLEMRPLLARP